MEPVLVAKIDLDTKYVKEKGASLWLSQYVEDFEWALFVTNAEGESILTATVNLNGYGFSPANGNVFIKDYSENEGVLSSLMNAGIVSKPIREITTGWTQVSECPLLFDTAALSRK